VAGFIFGSALLHGRRRFSSIWLRRRRPILAAGQGQRIRALFDHISSAVANVVVDGVFNIPLMKKLGYKPEFAAAVEATASTGGQIMPPVMGAGAFIMAELIRVAYLKIALAAAIPALLYYLGVAASIHFEARKSNLARIPKELIPSARKTLPKAPRCSSRSRS
jgi:TRAP-type uncharacterized transport system fused permease subunit